MSNYAIIEHGVVINIVVGPLPNEIPGVAIGEYPIAIGDSYADGVFYRENVRIAPEEPDSTSPGDSQ